jgi:hypothetical protein
MFGSLATVHRELETLARDFDAAVLDRAAAARAVDELGLIRRLVDAMVAKAAKRVEDTAAHLRGNDRDAVQFVARSVGIDPSEARRMIATAEKLEALPLTDELAREGRLSARQAQMIADAATINPGAERALHAAAAEGMVPLKDACIVARARVEDPTERSRRQHRARSLRTWNADDGMVEGFFRLTPEVGGRFTAAIEAETQRIFRERRSGGPHESLDAYAADALDGLLSGGTGKTSATVHVVVDHAALVRGNTIDGETCEIPGVGPVNVEWVRGLLGTAFVTAVIKKGRDISAVAHFGRHIPAELRTALLVAGRECDIEGCHCRGYLEIDHSEVEFAKGGPTAFWNLIWLCARHHRQKTLGWRLGPPGPQTGKRALTPPDRQPSAP